MVCKQMKLQHPEQYKQLTELKFRFNDVGTDKYGDFDLQLERPIIG